MERFALLAVLSLAGCRHEAATTTSSTSLVELHNGSGAITFETPFAKGTIAIASPMVVRCESKLVNLEGTTRWTIDGKEFDFAGPQLKLGGKSYGALKGESAIEVRADGVFVNGEKRGELTH
jgi:hypothetical protein